LRKRRFSVSEAAEKAYPHNGTINDFQQDIFREAFDLGAVTALREAADTIENGDLYDEWNHGYVVSDLRGWADYYEEGK
jgi:hypothetical protein